MFTVITGICIALFFMLPNTGCQNLKSMRVDEVKNKTAENVTSDDDLTSLTDKNASCTAFASFLSKQQLAKKSDQNLAENTINVCNTIYINKDCANWQLYGYNDQRDCREFYLKRK